MPFALAEWIGAHRVSGWESQERERALQRFVICGIIAVLDTAQVGGDLRGLPFWLVLGGTTYGLASLAYGLSLPGSRRWHVACLYGFLILDPIAVLLPIALDPETFVFLVPLVLLINTGPGMRYGMRALDVTLSLSGFTVIVMVGLGSFWKRELQWTTALVMSIALVPLFFNAQIRRIHSVRKLEEDRARLLASREAVSARAAFLSKVSHELRSPLQSMVSSLDVFELRHLDAARGDVELISRMRRASLLLNTQLRDLLTMAKGEAGRLDVRIEPFEAGELVGAMAESARPLATARGLTLEVEVPGEPVFVSSDGSRVDQILTNLVSNSIRFTDQGTVRVSLEPYDATARRLRFSVSDTGRGIAEGDLATLFNPEHQGATTVRRGEGSGIGLAIVRILIAHLGGTISVRSRLGFGTTFLVEIPAEAPVTPARASDAVDEPSQSIGERALVVDDRADVLEAIAGVLDEIGITCDRAASSREALQMLDAHAYSIAFLDLELQDDSGEALAQTIRQRGGHQGAMRLIAMTAGDTHRLEPAVRARFDGRLAKPVDAHALRRVLHGGTRESVPSSSGSEGSTR